MYMQITTGNTYIAYTYVKTSSHFDR